MNELVYQVLNFRHVVLFVVVLKLPSLRTMLKQHRNLIGLYCFETQFDWLTNQRNICARERI